MVLGENTRWNGLSAKILPQNCIQEVIQYFKVEDIDFVQVDWGQGRINVNLVVQFLDIPTGDSEDFERAYMQGKNALGQGWVAEMGKLFWWGHRISRDMVPIWLCSQCKLNTYVLHRFSIMPFISCFKYTSRFNLVENNFRFVPHSFSPDTENDRRCLSVNFRWCK